MFITNKALRFAVTACFATVMAGSAAIAESSVKAGHKEPGPAPPTKHEALQNKSGDKSVPKQPKNAFYLIQGSGGSYLMNRVSWMD